MSATVSLLVPEQLLTNLQALEKPSGAREEASGRFHSLMVSFLHSADWQIGKPYARILDPDKRARLRQVRLDAIGRIGSHIDAGTAFLLVAGDLFDSPTPSSSDVSAVCAAIGQLAIPVLVIPGNHDHGAPGTVWHGAFFQGERDRRAPNLQVLPRPPAPGAGGGRHSSLPAAAPHRLPGSLWLAAPTRLEPFACRKTPHPAGPWRHPRLRCHRPGSPATALRKRHRLHPGRHKATDADEENPAATGNRLRLEGEWLAQVDYIALGDWHGLKHVSAKAWYSGTPEPDRFPRAVDYQAGQVLAVRTERGALPQVQPLPTGVLGWHPLRFHCGGDADLERLEQQLDHLLKGRVGQDLLLLELSGSLSLDGQDRLERLMERLDAQLLRLKRRGTCATCPSAEELAALVSRPADPLISRVAGSLRQQLERSEAAPAGPLSSATPEVETLQRALVELHRALRSRAD